MSFHESTLLGLEVFLVWWLAVYLLRGRLEKVGITPLGPILMIRTRRGRRLLERMARYPRFWRGYASAGVLLMFAGMAFMFSLVLLLNVQAAQSGVPPPTQLNEPRNVFLIPGINAFVPLVWGILGLAVAIMVHELSHAVLCRVEGLQVKSMGILLAVLPIGAFAEPDEEELFGVKKPPKEGEPPRPPPAKIASQKERMRILAAGITGNFTVAAIAFLLLFLVVLPSLAPVAPSHVVVSDVLPGSPAEKAGFEKWEVLTRAGGAPVASVPDLLQGLQAPGATVESRRHRLALSDSQRSGITLRGVAEGSPAAQGGLQSGDIVARMDSTPIRGAEDFQKFMASTRPGQTVQVGLSDGRTLPITLGRAPAGRESGFLGVTYALNLGGLLVAEFPTAAHIEFLRSVPRQSPQVSIQLLMALPFLSIVSPAVGYTSFAGDLATLYQPTGLLAPLGAGALWLANILFWVGWINFFVGLFNCLPAVPLDGGHIFRELIRNLTRLLVRDETRREKMSTAIVRSVAFLIFATLVFFVMAPHIVHRFAG